MERPSIRADPPAQVIAEKFQTMVALGLANRRMKGFYDLWAMPNAMLIDDHALTTAMGATFERRTPPDPHGRPSGSSAPMAGAAAAHESWPATVESLHTTDPSL